MAEKKNRIPKVHPSDFDFLDYSIRSGVFGTLSRSQYFPFYYWLLDDTDEPKEPLK